jgi:predicted lipoprotein with Yx(FWY)xxD motif
MRHPRIIVASVGLAALAAAGGITAAAAGASSTTAPSAVQSAAATVHTAQATVGGNTETILVDGRGLPLYYYRADTATKSFVTGELAQLWPPLTSAAPTGAGVSGHLMVLDDVNGQQVTYNGHPLYTFADDHAGQVTGQGVQNFFVATPGIAPIAASAGSTAPTAPAVPSGGYGY